MEEILNTIRAYNELHNLVYQKIEIMSKLDNKYDTSKGIENIDIDVESVFVTCDDDSCMGSYDSYSFSFPTLWLSLEDEALEVVIEEVKNEELRKREELTKMRKAKDKEKHELAEYERLRNKFENK